MKPWNNGTIGKLKPVMKKLLIALLVLIAAYAIGAAVFAVANGQAEGKVLLAEKQIMADGDMEKSGTSDWSAGSDAVLSKESGAWKDGTRVLRVTILIGDGTGSASQNSVVAGKRYRAIGKARGDGVNGLPRFYQGSTYWSGTTSTDWQPFDVIFTAVGAGTITLLVSGNSATEDYVEFDDIVITEYSGKTTISGSQLLTDGDMEKSGTADYVPYLITPSKVSGAKTDGSRLLRLTYLSSPSSGFVYQDILTEGKIYEITGWARGDGTGRPKIHGGGGLIWTGTASATWQKIYAKGPASAARLYIYSQSLAEGKYVEFDDLVVTEYTGKTTTGGKQLLADGDMEKSGTGDWIQYLGRGTASKVSGGRTDGKQALRITADSSTFGDFYQTILTGGKTYRITGWARGDGVRKPILAKTAGTIYLFTGTASTEWQRVDVVFTANGGAGDTKLRFLVDGGEDHWVEFDDMIVVEL